jgi:integrase
VSVEQFDQLYQALTDPIMRLLVETDIETGLRWGELTELRPKDIDFGSAILTISRAVVEVSPDLHPEGGRFLVKDYPKNGKWRQVKLPVHLLEKLKDRIATLGLDAGDLLFELQQRTASQRWHLPAELPDPDTLGQTEANEHGRQYRHGTTSAYTAGKCRCTHCRNAMAEYRAARRASGKDSPRQPRKVTTDGHIGNNWFRQNIWDKALARARLGFRLTPHGLRHAHASWLLAGGADLQVVKEQLGHGSIRTTERYLHSLPGGKDAAVKALANVRNARQPAEGLEPAQDDAYALKALRGLAELRDLGVISTEEFDLKKAELLERI